jgi:alpha-galactosidase
VTCFQVGGYRPSTVVDFEIPKRYGLRQTIADTVGIGGIMRGLRTIPVLLDVCRDMEELCPDALLLNYVNPMAMLCWAAAEASPIRTVGLCHSVQHTTGELAADLGVPAAEVDHHVAGINHMAFFLRLERDGQDLYPALHDVLERNAMPEANQVRYEVLRHFGSFVTESSEHFAEYVPWFIKAHRPDLVERYRIPLDEYPRRCETALAEWEAERARLERPGPIRVEPSVEYGGDIIRACETGSRSPSTATSPTATPAACSSTTCPRTAASRCRASRPPAGSSRRPSAAARARSPRSCRRTCRCRASRCRPR